MVGQRAGCVRNVRHLLPVRGGHFHTLRGVFPICLSIHAEPEEFIAVGNRLQYLSARTGRSKTFYATEALMQYLDENEDYLLAKDALEEFTQSNDDAIDLAEWSGLRELSDQIHAEGSETGQKT